MTSIAERTDLRFDSVGLPFQRLNDGLRLCREYVRRPPEGHVSQRSWLVQGYIQCELCVVAKVAYRPRRPAHDFYLIFHRIPFRARNPERALAAFGDSNVNIVVHNALNLECRPKADAMLLVGYMSKTTRNVVVKGAALTSGVWLQPKDDIMKIIRNAVAFLRHSRPEAILSVGPGEQDCGIRTQGSAGNDFGSSPGRLVKGIFDVFDGAVGMPVNIAGQAPFKDKLDDFLADLRIYLNDLSAWPSFEMSVDCGFEVLECFIAPSEAFIGSGER